MDDHQLSNNITKLIEKNQTIIPVIIYGLLNSQHGSVLNICDLQNDSTTMASATFQCEIITFILKKKNIFIFFPIQITCISFIYFLKIISFLKII
jgi:hypothetical protein